VTANSALYSSHKTQSRADFSGETGILAVQIVGTEPAMLAEAARYNAARGAHIIDINMGCPAKKVCRLMAGSALMQDELKVARILEAVVQAVPDTPVTLKTRLGWDQAHKNVPSIARIAENAGIQALTIHGRTRCQGYSGAAEYALIGEVKQQVSIPVIANGDITSPAKARQVLAQTGADGLMIGRAAQGRPWLFREIGHYLATGLYLPPPSPAEIGAALLTHLQDLHAFYGEYMGVRMARKHIGWYVAELPGGLELRSRVNALESSAQQMTAVQDFFERALLT
ncbi:MAG: tRNA dihydrouridine synthase DusB, partial [Methylococcaceae bacterium]